MSVKILTGPALDTPLLEIDDPVTAEIHAVCRAGDAIRALRDDWRPLAQLMAEAEAAGWLGQPDRNAFIINVLQWPVQTIDLALEGLRWFDPSVPVTMDQAVKRGAEKQEEKGTFSIACMSPFLTTCETCKTRFPALRSHAKTCSPRCKKARQRKHRAELARNEWYTPEVVIEAARAVMGGIDLDPASSPAANKIVGAKRYYTIKDNGLKQPWAGRIWLNPPYGKQAPKFVVKFVAQHPDPVVAACLLLGTHHMTTKWFAPLAAFKPMMCLPDHRLHFSGSVTRPAHGSVILGFGVDPDRFRKAFACFGPVSTFG